MEMLWNSMLCDYIQHCLGNIYFFGIILNIAWKIYFFSLERD